MTQSQPRPRDEIDHFVDALLANPSRADEAKDALRNRLRLVRRAEPAVPDDFDLLWENVPV